MRVLWDSVACILNHHSALQRTDGVELHSHITYTHTGTTCITPPVDAVDQVCNLSIRVNCWHSESLANMLQPRQRSLGVWECTYENVCMCMLTCMCTNVGVTNYLCQLLNCISRLFFVLEITSAPLSALLLFSLLRVIHPWVCVLISEFT